MKIIKTIKGYYVYAHKNPQDEIAYIGKGKTYRAFCEAGRGDKHKQFMLSDQFDEVVIFKEGLTEDEAYALETELIATHRPPLNLIKPMSVSVEGKAVPHSSCHKKADKEIELQQEQIQELIKDIEAFFHSDDSNSCFPLSGKDNKWGPLLWSRNGRKLKTITEAPWFVELIKAHNYKVLSIRGVSTRLVPNSTPESSKNEDFKAYLCNAFSNPNRTTVKVDKTTFWGSQLVGTKRFENIKEAKWFKELLKEHNYRFITKGGQRFITDQSEACL